MTASDRTFTWPRQKGHAWQYATTHGRCAAVGVQAAAEPIPPPGRGWSLVNVIVLTGGCGEILFYWRRWKRA